MDSTALNTALHRLFVLVLALLATLALADAARANPCAGAEQCPWTGVRTVGDVGAGEFRAPYGVAADSSGNLYVVENDNHRVQKVDPSGAPIAAWGDAGEGDGDFSYPHDVAVDDSGATYVSDAYNYRIEKFDSSGNLVSAWGWGVADGAAAYQVCTSGCRSGISGAGAGQFGDPRGITIDGTHVYVVDASNKRIQKFDLAGNYVGQWAVGAQETPVDVFAAGSKLYVVTRADKVWRFDTDGNPDSSWDGDGVMGSSGAGAGQFADPESVTVDGTDVYVADTDNQRIQKLDSQGAFVSEWGGSGSGAGQFRDPYGVVTSGGSIWVADAYNHRLQKFSQAGAHQATVGSMAPGDFYFPRDVSVGPSGAVYVADSREIERLDANGTPQARFSTGVNNFGVNATGDGLYVVAGDSTIRRYDFGGNLLGQFGSYGTGIGQFRLAWGTAVDANGNLYVADSFNHRVQKFDSGGNFLSVIGTSGPGLLNAPYDVALDADGNLYVADSGNNKVVKFGPAGDFITAWGSTGDGDGQFYGPEGIAVDHAGNVLVSDTYNNRIEKFDSAGNFLTKWGAGGRGPGELLEPRGLAVDAAGGVWVTDEGNHRVVHFTPASEPGGGESSADAAAPAPSAPSGSAPAADRVAPSVKLSGAKLQRARRVGKSGLALRVTSDEAATTTLRARLSRRVARRLGLRSVSVAAAKSSFVAAGTRTIRLRLSAAPRRALARIGTRRLRIVVRASAVDRAGNRSSASFAVTVVR
jgi:tripartite motif-containing protein 71